MLIAGACSSSKSSSSRSTVGSSGGGPTYTIGVLADVTGLAAPTSRTTPNGVEAGVGLAAQDGYHIKYVVADTTSTPNGTLTAAQKLVDQDHVFAVIASSAFAFSAAPFLTSKNIPVIGVAEDSTEWITTRNMFSINGTGDYTKVYTQFGKFFKLVGVTNLGSMGYGVSPASADAAKGAAISAEAVGIKVGYLNANFPFGGTNVAPAALAMKNAGVDGFVEGIEPSSAFAVVDALRQQGVQLKAGLLPTGYGGDLTQGGPGAQQSAQGLYFATTYEPLEMHTAATQRFQNALKTYAGVTRDPTYAEYAGYVAVDAFVTGLKAAGSNPTQASYINTMLGITNYNAAGLWDGHSTSFAPSDRGQAEGADNCLWIVQYQGSVFKLVSGADPICGSVIPGKKV
jgi:branched-chain amino acid transport system substrate-binding protein